MESYEAYVLELNKKLKSITTYEEFKVLEKEVADNGLGFYSKRGGKEAYSFTYLYDDNGIVKNPYANIPKYKDRLYYLYNDTVSTGKAYVKNLYRFLEIR